MPEFVINTVSEYLAARAAGQTLSTDLISPEVWADVIEAELPGNLILADLGFMDNSLVGQPGDTINFTEWEALSDAEDVAEDESLIPEKLTQSADSATIKEAGKAVEITDKAILTALGDPIGTGQRQITASIARKIDTDLRTAILAAIPDTHDNYIGDKNNLDAALFVSGLAKFGDEFEPENFVFLIHSDQRAQLYNDQQFIDASKYGRESVVVSGEIGRLYGVPVKVSNRAVLKTLNGDGVTYKYNSILVRRSSPPTQDRGLYGPAYGTVWKRQVKIETDRDILARSTVIAGTVHYGVKVLDDSGIVILTTNDPTA